MTTIKASRENTRIICSHLITRGVDFSCKFSGEMVHISIPDSFDLDSLRRRIRATWELA